MRQRTGALFVAALFLGALGVLAVSRPAAAVSPSQVLVLYNAEWTDDAPLTDPGQDSKEIAEHYGRMRTDPATGEKPYLLGLSCGVQVQEKGEWSVRFNGRSAVTGPFVARASCEYAEGKTRRWEAEYQDFFDVACSRTGVDGIRDDKNYLSAKSLNCAKGATIERNLRFLGNMPRKS